MREDGLCSHAKFKLKQRAEGRSRRNAELIAPSRGARFRRMVYAVLSRYSRGTARLMRVRLPCEDGEGQEADGLVLKMFTWCTENSLLLWDRSLMSKHNKSVLHDLFSLLCTRFVSGVSLLGDL